MRISELFILFEICFAICFATSIVRIRTIFTGADAKASRFIRISSAHVDLIRNLMIHFTLRQIISDLVQSCHQIALSHFKTYRINCHFYESFHFMTIHSTCVVFLVITAAHRNSYRYQHKVIIEDLWN